MHQLLKRRVVVSSAATPTGANGPVDFNSTGDKFIFTPVVPSYIYRYGYILNSAQDPDAGGFQLDLDFRPTIGSDAARVNKASITRTDTQTAAAGAMFFNEVVLPVAAAVQSDGSTLNVDPAGPVRVLPGEEAVIEVSNANGAAATGYVFIDYVEEPFDITEGTLVSA